MNFLKSQVMQPRNFGGRFVINRSDWPAALIILMSLVVGAFYAAYTPTWQVPDEPAHYNYIRSFATGEGFPVMEAGDYDQAYLSRLTSEQFPESLPVTPLEYEDHQPPLYYLLATPIFLLSGGAVGALRLFSLLLGAGVIGMTMALVREVFPKRLGLAWLAGGLVAFLPQHVAMMAAVNNDALTELLWCPGCCWRCATCAVRYPPCSWASCWA
jgi:hypothetical protein